MEQFKFEIWRPRPSQDDHPRPANPVPNEIIPELFSQIASEFVILEKGIVGFYNRFLKTFRYVFRSVKRLDSAAGDSVVLKLSRLSIDTRGQDFGPNKCL